MKTKSILALIFFLLLMNYHNLRAQSAQDTIRYRVETSDGNEYIGTILSRDSLSVKLSTKNLGNISIIRKEIVKMTPISSTKARNGTYWTENPQATRYFISGNGYGLKSGEAYYQNTWVLFNQFNAGLTNNISFGGGLIPTFLLGGKEVPVWITPKIHFPIQKDKINVSAGALIGTTLGNESTSFGFLYGVSTFGSRDYNISLGLGYGFSDGEWSKHPLISLSALIRTGPRGYFITENYFLDAGDQTLCFLSLGGRQIIKRVGLDYGFFIPISKDIREFIAIPWLGLIIPLSK